MIHSHFTSPQIQILEVALLSKKTKLGKVIPKPTVLTCNLPADLQAWWKWRIQPLPLFSTSSGCHERGRWLILITFPGTLLAWCIYLISMSLILKHPPKAESVPAHIMPLTKMNLRSFFWSKGVQYTQVSSWDTEYTNGQWPDYI